MMMLMLMMLMSGTRRRRRRRMRRRRRGSWLMQQWHAIAVRVAVSPMASPLLKRAEGSDVGPVIHQLMGKYPRRKSRPRMRTDAAAADAAAAGSDDGDCDGD
eukprot:4598615-Pyramimonas_sp.AAC.1